MTMRLALACLLVTAVACVQAAQATPTPATVPSPAAERQASPATATVLLQVDAPTEAELVVTQPALEVRGRTDLDAVVTVNGKVVPVDASGAFSANVTLEPGPNTIAIVASDFQGSQQARLLTAIYVP